MEVYNKIAQELYNNNAELHTHQLRKDRGFRIVIRHLHSTTEPKWIQEQLIAGGYTPRFIRVIRHRYSGVPMNLFEVELQPTVDGSNEKILQLKRLGCQNIVVEKKKKLIDPVQCHRCQAFGHTRNYCRRQYICLKCAGKHATIECTKARNTPGKCANCLGPHIASYKGCKVFKMEQSKLAINKDRAEFANILQNGLSLNGLMPANTPRRRVHQAKPKQHQQQQQIQPLTPKPRQQQQQKQQQQPKSAKKQTKQPQQQKKPQQNNVANKQQQPKQQQQQQQQKQHHQKPRQQQQQHTPIRGNNNNISRSTQQQQQHLSYSQVAKSGNILTPHKREASGPACRHLHKLQDKLRLEQQQEQQQQQQQPDDCLWQKLQQNTNAIAQLGKRMDSILNIIQQLLSKSNLVNNPPSTQQSQQRQINPGTLT